MCEGCLYSVDRIEGKVAVLVADDGTALTVSVADLPGVNAGNMYRKTGGMYCRDTDAEMTRKQRVRSLQKGLSVSQ